MRKVFTVPSGTRFAMSLVAAMMVVACDRSPSADMTTTLSDAPVDSATPRSRGAALPRFGALMEGVSPAVVDVVTTRSVRLDALKDELSQPSDLLRAPMLAHGEDIALRRRELGSGFVISPDGYILTSAHVVSESEEVVVRFPNADRELAASVVGLDTTTDVALLKVDEPTPATVRFGASSELRVGDWVAAIGSPFGFSNTITAGIVSATRRSLPDDPFVSFIQTDVAINPGSSGGPLLNLHGEVVGINAVIYSRTGGYMGVSFAVPIEVALRVSEHLRKRGYVTRGHIGVHTQALTDKLARSFGTPASGGVLVAAVDNASPAARANLKLGDVVVTYNSARVMTVEELSRLVGDSAPGSKSTLEIWRNGQLQAVTVEVGEKPPAPGAKPAHRPIAGSDRLGLVLQELPPPLHREIGVERGVLVDDARGPANVSGLLPGDVITDINQTPVTSRQQFERVIAVQQAGAILALRILRGRDAVYVAVRVPD